MKNQPVRPTFRRSPPAIFKWGLRHHFPMMRCEVAVVGGGPAGATAARSLAGSGRDVVVLEAEPSPRDKSCGGGLRPSVINRFPHVKGLATRFLEGISTHAVMSSPGAPELSYTAPEGGLPLMYQTRRSVFDRVLLDDAVDQGARLEEGAKVTHAAGSAKGWRLRLEDGREVMANGLIGAGGAKCPLGRRLRVAARGTPTFPKERLAVAWAREFDVGEGFVEDAYGHGRTVRIDLREGGVTGYAWTFPKRSHVNVGFGALVGELGGGNGISQARMYAERLSRMGMLPREPIGGRWQAAPIPMGGPSGPLSRPGALSVGDCASLISPLSGDGIYYAMESGRLAAEVMGDAIGRGDLSAGSLSRYGTLVKRSIVRELKILSKVAEPMRNRPIETLRMAVSQPTIPPLVVQLFQGEGNLRRTAIRLYGKAILTGLRK